MKKIITICAVSIALFMGTFCTLARAAGIPPVNETQSINPVDVARAFALKSPAFYQGDLWCDMLISNKYETMWMSFMMRSDDGAITNLVINDVNIPLPKPIYGLPMGDGGVMRGVWLNIGAYTASGDFAGDGYFSEQEVISGDNMVVTLIPADIKIPIPINTPIKGGVEVEIEGVPNGYGYGVENGQLYVWLPPVGGSYSYVVRDSNGMVIGSGTIEPFEETVVDRDAYVGVSYAGNVVGMKFPQPSGYDSWAWLPLSFNCSIPTISGSNVAGAIIFTDVGTGGLELVLSGEYWVYVQQASDENGDMPFLELVDQSVSDQGWYETRMYTKIMNVGKVVITIIPKTQFGYRPYLNLHRYYGSPTQWMGEG